MKTHCAKTRRNALVNAKTNRAGSGRLERAGEPRGQCHPSAAMPLIISCFFTTITHCEPQTH